jgi:hypothetical protein
MPRVALGTTHPPPSGYQGLQMGRGTDFSRTLGVQVVNEWSYTSFPLPERTLVSKVEMKLDRCLNYMVIFEFTLKRMQPGDSQRGVLPGCSLAKSKFKKCRVCCRQDDIKWYTWCDVYWAEMLYVMWCVLSWNVVRDVMCIELKCCTWCIYSQLL